ncbi:MAG: DUF4982 domain-containing protein [Opitutales bacterium]|nr:DUF4982 domain-containing protein [Opitutales bacterium]
MKTLKIASTLFIVALGALTVFAKPTQRKSFDLDWKFAKFGGFEDCLASKDPGEAVAKPNYADGRWRKLDLPHDWGVESRFMPNLPNQTASLPWNAVGWYRKEFELKPAEGSRYFIDFDGVMMTPKVYVNGEFAGEWKYGYNSFRVDITKFLKSGKNLVAVRAENLPNSTRWYPGAGIYRHTYFVESPAVHIDHWGVFVHTPEVSGIKKINDKKPARELKATSAKVATETTVANTRGNEVEAEVVQEIYPIPREKEAKPLAKKSAKLKIAANASAVANVEMLLSSPKLWDVTSPSLYALQTTILINGKAIDRSLTKFGVRKAEWKTDGFYLNDRRVQIKGVCQHHDLGALGSAVHKRAIERQVEILQSFGCNSIRTSHNPPAPELLEICDEKGILVDAELFDCWKYLKEGKTNGYNLFWNDWRERDVRNFVLRDRNHPCVIAWSAGNEIEEQGKKDGPEIARELVKLFKKYDSTRQVTVGCNDLSASWNGFGKEFDVHGFNYKPNDYKNFANKNKQPFVASETSSCVSSRGFYSFPNDNNFDPFWRRNFCDNIAMCLVSDYGLYAPGWAYAPDVEFGALDDEPRCAGEYVWTGFDYLGEPTPWNLGRKPENDFRGVPEKELKKLKEEMERLKKQGSPARSSYFGIVDLCGFRKDRAWLYQSHWMPDVPMAHILPHWNWKGVRDGKIVPVMVYTSGDSAELFLNGKSLGKRTKKKNASLTGKDMNGDMRERYRLVWNDVKYTPGTLKVIAYKNGKKWAEDEVKTTGDAAKILATADREEISGDGCDLSYVTIIIADKDGLKVPTAKNMLKFSVNGAAEIVGVCNGDQTDQMSMKGTEMKAFAGMAQVILRGKRGASGKATLKISGEKLPVETVEIKVKKAN